MTSWINFAAISQQADNKCQIIENVNSSPKKKRKMSTSSNESFGTPPEEIMEFAASDNLSNAELKRIMDEPLELEEIPQSPEWPNFNMFDVLTTPIEEQDSSKFQKKTLKKLNLQL